MPTTTAASPRPGHGSGCDAEGSDAAETDRHLCQKGRDGIGGVPRLVRGISATSGVYG